MYFNQNNITKWYLNAKADKRIQLSSVKPDAKEICKNEHYLSYHIYHGKQYFS